MSSGESLVHLDVKLGHLGKLCGGVEEPVMGQPDRAALGNQWCLGSVFFGFLLAPEYPRSWVPDPGEESLSAPSPPVLPVLPVLQSSSPPVLTVLQSSGPPVLQFSLSSSPIILPILSVLSVLQILPVLQSTQYS